MSEKTFVLLCKIFCIGLLLQFIANTFVSFQIGWDNTFTDIFRLWKEFFVIAGSLFVTYSIWKNKMRRQKDIVRYMTLVFIALMGFALVVTLGKGLSIGRFLKAWKYDFIGYMIFLMAYYLSYNYKKETLLALVQRFLRVIKTLLVWAVIWYFVLLLKPGALKLLGYDRLSIEGEVGKRPPAVYWTREFEGYPRNQFLFERPISWGFFLIAFFPLFFVQFLQRKSMKKTWFRWLMFGGNIVLTFSRAARLSWIFELMILGFISYRKQIHFFAKKVLIPTLIVFAGIARVAKDQVINRQFSNTGHIQLLKQGRTYFAQHRITGMGAGSVGPASHWIGGLNFNPENQYLQIAIEFGIIGFVIWMAFYSRLHYIGYKELQAQRKQKQLSTTTRYIIAFSIGMVGLSVSGLVLHSFTDRMIIYPFMLLGGIIYYLAMHPIIEKQKGGR